MAYLALYHKWRPRTFSEVIGQDAIMTALKNQVKSGRIGHAYLFCGTRGTGKTSTAKIFARAVNCLHPVDGDPCNQCELCLEGESDFNVIEIDAASNNGVDSIRELREEVRYAPSRGKYKVYIIDEVHMLSTSAFNALLKTLEEPPAHVIFILATTEPHKLLPTILSRCQRYDFRRISAKDLTGQLIRLSKAEGIDADEAALSYIADAADGASRDALSILDQCAAFYMDQRITLEKVLDVLGATDRRLFYTMTGILLTHDKTACLKELEELFASGKDTSRFLLDWISYLRNILLLQMMGDEALSFIVAPESEIAGLRENAGRTGPETISYYIEELSKLELSLRGAAEKRILLEVGLLRLCRLEDTISGSILARLEQVEGKIARGIPVAPTAAVSAPTAAASKSPEPKKPTPVKPSQPARPSGAALLSAQQWADLKQQLMQENRGYYILNMIRMESDDTAVYLIADRAVYRDQLLVRNQEKLSDIASHIRVILGREVPVRALTKDEYEVRSGQSAPDQGLDSLIASFGGPVRIE